MPRPAKPAETAVLNNTQRGAAQEALQERLRKERVLHERIASKLPRAPKHLGKYGKEAWREYGETLVELRLLTKLDFTSFTAFCECVDAYHRLLDTYAGLGHPVMDKTGEKLHPLGQEIKRARSELLKLCSAHGFTPVTRVKLAAVPTEDTTEQDDIF